MTQALLESENEAKCAAGVPASPGGRADATVGGGELAGVTAAIYFHGMGETRSKWVSVEHCKFISSLLGMHVLIFDYRGRRRQPR